MSLLVAENLSYSYAKNVSPAISKVSITVEPGTLTALVGPNGAGKSTLLRILQGQCIPDNGQITIDGEKLIRQRSQVALMPQRSSMNWKFPITVEKLVSLGQIKYSKSKSSSPFQIKALLANPNAWINKCCELEATMQRVGIASLANRRLDSLSGGQQQRVAIARALAMEPDMLLFDEPTSALDPELVGEVLQVMRNLAEEGRTMIVVTHEIGFAQDVSSRVVFLHEGSIEEEGAPSVVFKNPSSERFRQFISKKVEN